MQCQHFTKNQQIITSNGEEETFFLELNEIKSANIYTQQKICLKATTHSQADQHVQYTECLESYINKLLASAQIVNHRRYICHYKFAAR